MEKREKVFMTMNIKLYEKDEPKNIIISQNNNENTPINNDEIKEEKNEDSQINNINITDNDVKYRFIGILEIPIIKLKQGFLDVNSPYNNIDKNITVIKNSNYPDVENSNLILAAHSGNSYISYFKNLYKLGIGDQAFIYYDGVKYTYIITNIYEQEKNGKVTIKRDVNKKTLTLITCTKNNDFKQTIYIAELINEIIY